MAKILVAEDEPDIRDLIKISLEFCEFEVVSVTDGVEAVETAKNDSFDLILLDVRMPRLTGYEACRQLRAMDGMQNIPIVFLSAKGQESEVRSSLDAGADRYINKPFIPSELAEKLQQILGSNQA